MAYWTAKRIASNLIKVRISPNRTRTRLTYSRSMERECDLWLKARETNLLEEVQEICHANSKYRKTLRRFEYK